MAGLNGVGHVASNGSVDYYYFALNSTTSVTPIEHSKQILSCSSFLAPSSQILLMLWLGPNSPKLLRGCQHRLFLSLLTDSRFKSRFAVLGAVVYRPTSTLFCAGIGTETDTLLGFTVQLLATGSLVTALRNSDAAKALLCREDVANDVEGACTSARTLSRAASIRIFWVPRKKCSWLSRRQIILQHGSISGEHVEYEEERWTGLCPKARLMVSTTILISLQCP